MKDLNSASIKSMLTKSEGNFSNKTKEDLLEKIKPESSNNIFDPKDKIEKSMDIISQEIPNIERILPPEVKQEIKSKISNTQEASGTSIFEGKSYLSDSTNKRITAEFGLDAALHDDLELCNELGLMTNDFHELAEMANINLESLENDNMITTRSIYDENGKERLNIKRDADGNIEVRYDSDGDGQFDRIAQYDENGAKLSEEFDADGNGRTDYYVGYDNEGHIVEYMEDTENDGDYDYVEQGEQNGYNRAISFNEETGEVESIDTTFADGSRRVYINSDPENSGFEEVATFDKDGNFVSKTDFNGELDEPIQDETNYIPYTRPTKPGERPVTIPEDNEPLPEDNEVLPEAPTLDETQNSNQTPNISRPNVKFRENYTME